MVVGHGKPLVVEVRNFGLFSYVEGLSLQEEAVKEVASGKKDAILLPLTFPETITLGRRAAPSEVHIERWHRRVLGIELYYVERGGGATFHSPGQAIIYPVVRLDRFRLGAKELVELIASSTLKVLKEEYGIEARYDPERPGVWVEDAKIASIGLQICKGISTHGIAIYVDEDLYGFSLIDPCKMPHLQLTCIRWLLRRSVSVEDVALKVAHQIEKDLLDPRPTFK